MIGNGSDVVVRGSLRLREITRADAPLLYSLRLDPETRLMFRSTAEVSFATHCAFLERYFSADNNDRWYVIESHGRTVGTIALYSLSADGLEAEWGRFVVAPGDRGAGIGRAALSALIDEARRLGVRRLRCEVLATNLSALALYQRLGFREVSMAEQEERRFVTMLLDLTEVNAMDPIHLFVPTFRVDETLNEIRECLERGWTGLGYKTVAFEEAWSRYSGLRHSHFVNSATAGLHLAFRVLGEANGWRRGDEVISSPLTFVSTNHAILYEGLVPVFADVDESLCLDPASVESKISDRTRAVCFVGLGGNPGRWHDVLEICRRRGLVAVLDAAHMAGTWVDCRHVGHDADVAVFSFQAVKNLPTADSGMVCFSSSEHDAAARRWTWLGINKDTYTRTLGSGAYKWLYDVEHVGFKYHGNSIMAAMGLVGLKYLETDNERRREISGWYDQDLGDDQAISRVPISPGCTPSRHLYQILVENRDALVVALNERGIFPGVHYRDNTLYPMYAYGAGTCPRARLASERVVSLPLHLRLSREDVARVACALRELVAR